MNDNGLNRLSARLFTFQIKKQEYSKEVKL